MTAARLDRRGTQKDIISAQEQEIVALKAQVASLQRELEAVRSGETGKPGRISYCPPADRWEVLPKEDKDDE